MVVMNPSARSAAVALLCMLGAACAGPPSRGDWDAPPRPERAPNRDARGDARKPDPMRVVVPDEIERALAPGEQPPTRREVSLHPGAPVPGLLAMFELHLAAVPVDRTRPDWREHVPPPPDLPVETRSTYHWVLHTTLGPLTIELLPAIAPHHVLNTAWLTHLGYYDGLTFHRIARRGFAQGGCPRGDGTAGPGYPLATELPRGGPRHDRRGVVGMVTDRAGADGSQFYVTFGPAPQLDATHTILGLVVDGESVLRGLEANATPTGRPRQVVTIQRAELRIR